MVNQKYMTGKEYVDKSIARTLKLHPIAVWRAKKLAEKLNEVMEECPGIQSIDIFCGRVFCHRYASAFCVPSAYGAVAVFKLWVVCNPLILENVLESYGFDCELANVSGNYFKTYYYIRKHEED